MIRLAEFKKPIGNKLIAHSASHTSKAKVQLARILRLGKFSAAVFKNSLNNKTAIAKTPSDFRKNKLDLSDKKNKTKVA